jgi:hypothetical protein
MAIGNGSLINCNVRNYVVNAVRYSFFKGARKGEKMHAGLSYSEAEKRLREAGFNEITAPS